MEDMTFFVVSEEKLDNLTDQNDDAARAKAFGSALGSFGSGLAVAAIYADHLSSFAQAATYLFAPLCLAGAAYFFVSAFAHQKRAGGLLGKIKARRLRAKFEVHASQAKLSDDPPSSGG